jgi:tRNA dimethylallyltransferase
VTAATRHAVLVGATATGKSALALALARADPAWEILSVDSMQVYRGMDIGTAKPTPAEQAEVPHHLIDVLDPWEDATVAWYQTQARAVLADLEARGKRGLLVGGTGLYVQAVVDDLDIPGQHPEVRAALEAEPDTAALHARLRALDPVAAARMEPGNRRRVVRALEVTLGSGRPFSSFGPGVHATPARPSRCWASRWTRRRCPSASSLDSRSSWPPGSWTRCAGWSSTRGGCRAPPDRRSATRS